MVYKPTLDMETTKILERLAKPKGLDKVDIIRIAVRYYASLVEVEA